MFVSFSHWVTFSDPMMCILPAVSPNTLALAAGWNLPFLLHTFQSLKQRSETRYGGCSAGDIAAYTEPLPGPRPQSSKADAADATRWLTNFLCINGRIERLKTRSTTLHRSSILLSGAGIYFWGWSSFRFFSGCRLGARSCTVGNGPLFHGDAGPGMP